MVVLRKFMPVVLTAVVLFTLVVPSATAAGTDDQLRIQCDDGRCSLAVDLDGVSDSARFGIGLGAAALFQVLKGDALPAGATVDVSEDLVLSLPIGDLSIPNADLALQLAEDNTIERLRGRAELPLPSLALFEDVEIVLPASVTFGLDRGDALDYPHASLDPDRQYFFFNLGEPPVGERDGRQLLPGGRTATVIVDTAGPLVYVTGNLSIRHNGLLGMAGGLLEGGELTAPGLDGLPLGQAATVHLAARFGDELADGELAIGGGYGVDQGLLGDWIGLDVTPVNLQGLVTMSPDGIKVEGIARTSVEATTLFDGGVRLEAYLPLSDGAGQAYVQLSGDLELPIVRSSAAGTARLDAAPSLTLTGALDTPLHDEPAYVDVTIAPDRAQMAAVPGAVRSWLSAAALAAGDRLDQGYDVLAQTVAAGVDQLTDGLRRGASQAGEVASPVAQVLD